MINPNAHEAVLDPNVELPSSEYLVSQLTERQARFAHLFARDGNASRAAREAGYSIKNAPFVGPKLTKKASVAQAIAAIRAEMRKTGDADAAEVLAHLNRQALGDVTELLIKEQHTPHNAAGEPTGRVQHIWRYREPDELTPSQRALVASVSLNTRHMTDGTIRQTISYKTVDQQRSIADLIRVLGMNQDKTTVTHSGSVAVAGVFAFIAENPGAAETTRRIGASTMPGSRRQPLTLEHKP